MSHGAFITLDKLSSEHSFLHRKGIMVIELNEVVSRMK